MEKMVCIKEGPWINQSTGSPDKGPKYGESVEILRSIEGDLEYYLIEGYMGLYLSKWFVPLDEFDITELEEILESQTEEV